MGTLDKNARLDFAGSQREESDGSRGKKLGSGFSHYYVHCRFYDWLHALNRRYRLSLRAGSTGPLHRVASPSFSGHVPDGVEGIGFQASRSTLSRWSVEALDQSEEPEASGDGPGDGSVGAMTYVGNGGFLA
jgi:hypothetical protein